MARGLIFDYGGTLDTKGCHWGKVLWHAYEQSHVPVVVDAGIGLPSHAAEAIELGADAVLANTAVAAADDPVAMARAFGLAVQAAELALRAGPPSARATASATSPMDIFK